MATLDEKTLDGLTQLCRVRCSTDEKAQLLNDLQHILDYIEQLDDVDTTDVEPCNTVLELKNVMRDDLVREEQLLDHDSFLANAPASEDGLILVPTVIRKSQG